ncbi:MAG: hypothetical protein KC646_11710 [Candidatus Cloacimonetes bacterium]|nr:hypothetical protein [Candidatus Cloacimonadota bacterium]
MKVSIIQTLDPQRDNSKSKIASETLLQLLQNQEIISHMETQAIELEINTLAQSIQQLCKGNDIIFTIGGTGLGLDDCVPEASKSIYQRECPGIAELMRSETAKINKKAWISRYTAGIYNNCLIVNFPGKKSSVTECFECAHDIILHTAKMLCKLK